MKGSTFAQRQRRIQRDLINEASRRTRGLTVYPATGPTLIVHDAAGWADNPRKRDKVLRPGGKLPARVSAYIRRNARKARGAS